MGLVQALDIYATEYIEDFFLNLESDDTRSTYHTQLNEFSNIMMKKELKFLLKSDIALINSDMIIRFINDKYKVKTVKNNTLNNKLSAIKSFMKYMRMRKLSNIDVNDFEFIKNKKDDTESYDTIPMWMVHEILLDFQDNEKRLLMQKTWFVKLAVETGLRPKEVLALRKDNFTPYFDGIHMLVKSKDAETRSKGNKDWKELIHMDLYYQMIEELDITEGKLFTMSDSTMLKTLHRSIDRLGYSDDGYYVLHSFKRTAVNNTKRFTNDMSAAQAKGKHSSANTTKIYMDEVDYGATGFYSMQCKVDTGDLIQKSSHEELLKAIDNMDESVKMLLEIELQKLKGEN